MLLWRLFLKLKAKVKMLSLNHESLTNFWWSSDQNILSWKSKQMKAGRAATVYLLAWDKEVVAGVALSCVSYLGWKSAKFDVPVSLKIEFILWINYFLFSFMKYFASRYYHNSLRSLSALLFCRYIKVLST